MNTSYETKQTPLLLGMLLLVLFIIVIASIAYSVKYYINEFNKPNITTKQKVGLWLGIAFTVIIWAGLIYLGITYKIFAKMYAIVTGAV